MIKGGRGFTFFRDPATGREMAIVYSPVRAARYSLGMIVSKDRIMAPVTSLRWSLGVILILAVLLAVSLSLFVARRMARPIDDLNRAAGELARGNLDHRLDPAGKDEVAQLSRAFNEMAETIQGRQRDLAQSEKKYRDLVDNLPIGLYRDTPGPEGQFLFANPAIARMFGFDSVDEFIQTPVSNLYAHPGDRESFSQKLLTTGRVQSEQLRLKKNDGTIIWGAVTAVVIRGPSGEIEHFEGMIEDITDQKRAEEAIRRAEERYRILVEDSFDGVFIQKGTKIVFTNKRLREMLGYEPGELEGLDHWLVFHPDYQALTRNRARAW